MRGIQLALLSFIAAGVACSSSQVALDPLAPVPTRVDPNEISTPPLRVSWTVTAQDDDDENEVPTHAAAVGTNGVYVAYANRLDALRIEDGEKLWEAHLGAPLAFAPLAFRGGVVIASGDRWLWLDAAGAATASANLSGSVRDALVVDDRLVVVDDENVRLFESTGAGSLTMSWSTSQPAGRRVNVSRDGASIYLTREDGTVTALAMTTGNLLWHNTEIEVAPLRPATGRAVYVVDRDGRLNALRHRDGQHMWIAKDIGMRVNGSPVEREGLIWVPGLDAAVHAFTQSAGSHQHRIRGNGRIHLDLAAWGPWVIASPQYGPWTIVHAPRSSSGPADPGTPRVLQVDSSDDLALPPAADAAGEIGVVVIDAAGTIRLLTPEKGAAIAPAEPETAEQ